MIQAHHGYSVPDVILEITELANRFRETPQTIKDALRLLRDIGRAEPADLDGCWKLQLAGTLPLLPYQDLQQHIRELKGRTCDHSCHGSRLPRQG
jgi:hypothetical protein